MRSLHILRQFDYILLTTTIFLVIFGILMIRSATTGAIDPDLVNRVPDQIQFALIGFVLLIMFASIDYRILGGLHLWLYLLMVGSLILVPIIGVVGDAGARRWINVGILIQPSELGKIIIIVTLGYYLSRRYERIDRFSTILGSLLHVSVPIGLIFIQPNLGTAIVFLVIWATLIWAAGLRLEHIALFVLVVLVSLPIIWSQMEDYQRGRITTFLADDEEGDTQGATFNIRQAAISIGSGGLIGKGYSNGTQTQLRFLRVRHTDFIFSVIAEEFGFVGGMTVLAFIGLIVMRILRGARRAVDPLGSMICYGVASIIFFQTFVSIGMNLGMLPVTGLTLPFISSGGTSLLAMMAGIGLAESVISRRRRV